MDSLQQTVPSHHGQQDAMPDWACPGLGTTGVAHLRHHPHRAPSHPRSDPSGAVRFARCWGRLSPLLSSVGGLESFAGGLGQQDPGWGAGDSPGAPPGMGMVRSLSSSRSPRDETDEKAPGFAALTSVRHVRQVERYPANSPYDPRETLPPYGHPVTTLRETLAHQPSMAGAVASWIDLIHGNSEGLIHICSAGNWEGRTLLRPA